jgi:hypothetical protein
MLYAPMTAGNAMDIQGEGKSLPCKSYWIENTKDLVLFIWNDLHSEAIVVPEDGWMIRNDITIH